jgi:hypothetical protein
MPLYKFKSSEEAERALWNFNPDKNYYKKIRDFFRFAFKICRTAVIRRGLTKFRSIEESNIR